MPTGPEPCDEEQGAAFVEGKPVVPLDAHGIDKMLPPEV